MTKRRMLLLNARRRIPMARMLAERAKEFGITEIVCCDTDYSDALRFACDGFFIQPPLRNVTCVEQLCTKLKYLGIGFILPWLDRDILILSENAEILANYGIVAFTPPVEYTTIFTDKQKTVEWAHRQSINTPRTIDPNNPSFPAVAKLRKGQGGFHVHVLSSVAELDAAGWFSPDEYILQELIVGEEYTVDVVLNGRSGVHCVIPRRRLKVRGSEVVVAETSEDPSIIEWIYRVVNGMHFHGIINIQLFATSRGCELIEINPRFGGGSELSIAAGADLPSYILSILIDGEIKTPPPTLRSGLVMTRHLEAAFFHKDNPLIPVRIDRRQA